MIKIPEILLNKIESKITKVKYEGDSLDSDELLIEIEDLIIGLLKGFGTYCLQNYDIVQQGWKLKNSNKILSRSEVIKCFLNQTKL